MTGSFMSAILTARTPCASSRRRRRDGVNTSAPCYRGGAGSVHLVHARRYRHVVIRRSLAVAAVAATVLTGCTATVSGRGIAQPPGSSSGTSPAPTGPAPSSALPPPQPAAFTDCSSLFNLSAVSFPPGRKDRLSFSCARLSVPLDYNDPGADPITLELVKVHDSANNTGNALVVNPGGPGGSGVELAIGLAAQVSDKLLSRFDLLGFDPRGVGLSSPISCISDSEKDRINAAAPDVLTAAGLGQAKKLAQDVASACTARYGSSLADFNTVQTAKDMDRIRAALGQDKLSYLGFSYGTELGSVYAHLFPANVGVTVLDGAVDPLSDDITSFADQLKGFEGAFDQFQEDCLNRSPCKALRQPRQLVYSLVKQADQTPIRSSEASETRRASGSIVLTGVLSALYSQSEWPALGQALIDAKNGDAKGLFELADNYNQRSPDGHYSNISDANTTIGCNDSKPGPSDATIKATAAKWVKAYPMFGRWAAPSLFSCQAWQPDRTPVPLPRAATPQTVLVIGNLHDPATPYQGAKDLTKTMGNAALLTWDGEGHTSYLQGSSCIDNFVDDYLVAGTLPPANTTCPR
jgi:pimeloyl-ACP methyl ester carboxylesterase